VVDPAIDHRIWGLNDEDSCRVLGLYDKGRVLIEAYNKVQKDIETRQDSIMEVVNATDDWDYEFSCGIPISNFDPDMSDHEPEIALRRAKIKHFFGRDTELCDLMKEREAARDLINQVATMCADLQRCPGFTAIILEKLPRELRDQIYDYLWMGQYIESMDQAISFAPKYYLSDEAGTTAPDLPVPRFANATFVGVDFASEAAARYFRSLSNAELDYRYVRVHLERNNFGPMEFAVRDNIQHLVMTIDEKHGTIYPGKRIASRALDDSMNSLLMLKDNRSLRVEIYLEPGMQWSLAFYQALEVIKPVFLTLCEANINIRVLGYDFFSTTEDDDADIFSEELNRYLTAATPVEWLDMKAKEIKEMPPGPFRQRCNRVSHSFTERDRANNS
jgi:hypothetical protein